MVNRLRFVALALGLAAAGPLCALPLQLRDRVELTGTRATVGDVLRPESMDAALATQLAPLEVARLPASGAAARIDVKQVRAVIVQRFPALGARLAFATEPPTTEVVVRRQRISGAALGAAVEAHFASSCVAQGGACSVTPNAPADLEIAAGEVTIEVIAGVGLAQQLRAGHVTVLVAVDGVRAARRDVHFTYAARLPVAIARQAIDATQAIRADDVAIELGDVAALDFDAVGYDTRHGLLRARRAISVGDIFVPPAVPALARFRAGETVPAKVAVGPVRVRRAVTLLQDAAPGGKAFVKAADGGVLVAAVARGQDDRGAK